MEEKGTFIFCLITITVVFIIAIGAILLVNILRG